MLDVIDNGVFVSGLGRFPVLGNGRRRQVAGVVLGGPPLAAYNAVLRRVCPTARELEADQIASIGRRVLQAVAGRPRRFVAARLADVHLLAQLRDDAGWPLAPALAGRIDALLSYVRRPHELIPDQLPALGRLDDAILVDQLRRDIKAELADYRDFCSFRLELAERRRVPPERLELDTGTWLSARCSAVAAARAARQAGYAPRVALHAFRVA